MCMSLTAVWSTDPRTAVSNKAVVSEEGLLADPRCYRLERKAAERGWPVKYDYTEQ